MIAIVHRCPTCGRMHEVTRARAEMAHPAQLCCSPECEAETRRRSGARALRSLHARTEAAAFIAVLALISIVLAIKWA